MINHLQQINHLSHGIIYLYRRRYIIYWLYFTTSQSPELIHYKTSFIYGRDKVDFFYIRRLQNGCSSRPHT